MNAEEDVESAPVPALIDDWLRSAWRGSSGAHRKWTIRIEANVPEQTLREMGLGGLPRERWITIEPPIQETEITR